MFDTALTMVATRMPGFEYLVGFPSALKRGGSHVAVEDVYLLTLHQPFEAPGHPVPINAVIVHAQTLLNAGIPQPHGGMVYRCLVEAPLRTNGEVVPLSTLTFELDGGELWDEVADWALVVDALAELAATKGCDAIMLGLPEPAFSLLAGGPTSTLRVYTPDGTSVLGGRDRQQQLDELTAQVRAFVAQGPFWPGEPLVAPPTQPRVMPYKRFDS